MFLHHSLTGKPCDWLEFVDAILTSTSSHGLVIDYVAYVDNSILPLLEFLLNVNTIPFQVNLSVAIIPMSHQYGWNSSTAGLVQSSFFWGYALSQLPGGWLAKLVGGRFVWVTTPSCAYINTNTNTNLSLICSPTIFCTFLVSSGEAEMGIVPIKIKCDDDSYFFFSCASCCDI